MNRRLGDLCRYPAWVNLLFWPKKSVQPFTRGDLREYEFDNGTRLFAELWDTCTVVELKTHASKLRRLKVQPDPNQLDPDALLSFEYNGFEFFVVSSQGEYMFFVCDVTAPDSILMAVATHFNKRLRQTTKGPKTFSGVFRFAKLDTNCNSDENAG